MNIGQISLCYRPITGGQERYIESLTEVLARRGHRSTVYQSLSVRYQIDRAGIDVSPALPLLPRLVPNLNWYFFNLCLRLKRRLLAREDVLIVHYAVHWPAVRYHRRVIVVSHGIEWRNPPQSWDDRARAARALESFADGATVVANDTDYLRHCGVAIEPGSSRAFEEVAPRKFYIPNCIDSDHFRRVAPNERLAALNPILVPRNIYFHRGIHLAIDAFARLVADGDREHSLVVVGAVSNAAYHAGLLDQIDAFGLQGRVHFWGPAARAEMPALYSAAACTVIPSIYSEGTSLSALESMACGAPVVASSIGGLLDLPAVHAAPEAGAMAAALARVLAERAAYSGMQQSAVRNTFTLDKWASAWERVLTRAAEENQ